MTAWIERLNADALAHIFHIATDTGDGCDADEGIRGAITISQVCSHWRSLILDLPTIWARLINFESKILLDCRWNQEILRRSVDAPLQVKIRYFDEADDKNDHSRLLLAADVLEKEWHRVQYISIEIDFYYDVKPLQNLASLLHRPAPSLETFEWLADSGKISLTSPTDTTDLFGNNAPMIRNFCYDGGLSPMSMSSQWLSTLKTLKLHIRSPNITDLLRTLEKIPLLEILEIHAFLQDIEFDPPSLSQRIHLSHLQVLRLSGWWKSCTDMIDAIDFVALSELEIQAHGYHPDKNPRMDLQGFGLWFARLLRSHLSLMRTPSAFIAVLKPRRGDITFDFKLGKYQATFSDSSDNIERQHHIATWFLQLLSSFNLDSVTELKFNVNLNSRAVFPHRTHIRDVFCSLSHLTKICAAGPWLKDIRELLCSVNGVFPSLHTIKIPNIGLCFNPKDRREQTLGILYSFMSWRIDDGRPIEVLELEPGQDIFEYNADGRYPELEGFPDITSLIWIQGSGDVIKQQIRR